MQQEQEVQQGQEVQEVQQSLEGQEVCSLPQLLLRSASSAFQIVFSTSLKSRL